MTDQELLRFASDLEADLLDKGIPFSGHNWMLMQLVRRTIKDIKNRTSLEEQIEGLKNTIKELETEVEYLEEEISSHEEDD